MRGPVGPLMSVVLVLDDLPIGVKPRNQRLVIAANRVVHSREVHVDMDDVEVGRSQQVVCYKEAIQHLGVAFEVEGVHLVVGKAIDEVRENPVGVWVRL